MDPKSGRIKVDLISTKPQEKPTAPKFPDEKDIDIRLFLPELIFIPSKDDENFIELTKEEFVQKIYKFSSEEVYELLMLIFKKGLKTVDYSDEVSYRKDQLLNFMKTCINWCDTHQKNEIKILFT